MRGSRCNFAVLFTEPRAAATIPLTRTAASAGHPRSPATGGCATDFAWFVGAYGISAVARAGCIPTRSPIAYVAVWIVRIALREERAFLYPFGIAAGAGGAAGSEAAEIELGWFAYADPDVIGVPYWLAGIYLHGRPARARRRAQRSIAAGLSPRWTIRAYGAIGRPAARGALGGGEQLVAEVGVGDRGERLAALVDGLALELGGAVLGHDHVDLVARRRDHRARLEPGHDPRAQLAVLRSYVAGKQSSERSSRSSAGPAMKSSWPPMPENCAPPIVSATTWPWMSIASAPLIVIIFWLRAIASAELTSSTGRNATSLVLVEPLVELLAAGGEGRDRDARRSSPCGRSRPCPASCSAISPFVNISEWTP